MGSGIAQVCAQAGLPTVAREVDAGLVEKGMGRIRKFLDDGVAKGKVEAAVRDKTLENLKGTTNVADLADCDLVIEAIVENLDAKRALYTELDKVAKPEAIFASNTSSLSITEMMTATARADRFVGLHFFNPVPLMKLVEVVGTIVTDPAVLEEGKGFVGQIGKTPVTARDSTGFVVNRLLVPYLLDAIRMLEAGVASREDIDNAMKLGCGYPMGPLTLLDFVGLDTTHHIAEIMFKEYREARYAPPPLLKRMVLAGMYGKKSGKGFYDYSANPPIVSNLGL
jgi:3-hydroxybutyryl-CoA dehydrogenase